MLPWLYDAKQVNISLDVGDKKAHYSKESKNDHCTARKSLPLKET